MQGTTMIFIINHKIHFRPADGTIWNNEVESEKSHLTLTRASSRLLTFLIENQGKILTRNDILKAVWGKYGQHSSNNTLNQYISLLRRMLSNFGLGVQVIKTIPKTGFLLSTDIHIVANKEFDNAGVRADAPLICRNCKKLGLLLLLVVLFMLFTGVWQSRTGICNFSTGLQPGASWQQNAQTPSELVLLV